MIRKRSFFLVLISLAVAAALAIRSGKTRPVPAGWPVNVGHRGASVRYPENTLASFRGAVEAGAGGLELDVHLTRDGHPVVMHDPKVDRTTDGFGTVSGMTLAEVRRLDVGGAGRADEGVPTLREVLAAFPDVSVNIDIKDSRLPGAEEVVLGVLREAGAMRHVLVASVDHGVLRRFRKISDGRCDTGASRLEIGVFWGLSLLGLERLLRPAYAALQVPVTYGSLRVVTPRFVRAAHSLGVRVDVWTINDPNEMRRLLDLGVDSIMTDRPEALAEVLEGRGPG
jgi:glycerophosphoryl diester phosphodiesterase